MRALCALATLGLILAMVGVVAAQPSSSPIQHGAQPNPGEVRPSSPDGDASSPSAGTLRVDRAPNWFWGAPRGLVVTLAVVVLVLLAGLIAYARRQPPRVSQRG